MGGEGVAYELKVGTNLSSPSLSAHYGTQNTQSTNTSASQRSQLRKTSWLAPGSNV